MIVEADWQDKRQVKRSPAAGILTAMKTCSGQENKG
jgi:hypothetical protein